MVLWKLIVLFSIIGVWTSALFITWELVINRGRFFKSIINRSSEVVKTLAEGS